MPFTDSATASLIGVRRLLANAAAFREWLEVDDEEAANAKILAGSAELPPKYGRDDQLQRPYALLQLVRHGNQLIGVSETVYSGAAGTVAVTFSDVLRDGPEGWYIEGQRHFGKIIDDVVGLMESDYDADDAHLQAMIELHVEMHRSPFNEREAEDFVEVEYLFHHDIGDGGE